MAPQGKNPGRRNSRKALDASVLTPAQPQTRSRNLRRRHDPSLAQITMAPSDLVRGHAPDVINNILAEFPVYHLDIGRVAEVFIECVVAKIQDFPVVKNVRGKR